MKKNNKKKYKKKKNTFNFYKLIIIFLIIIIAALSGFLISYFFMQKEFKKEITKQQNIIQTLEDKIKKLEKENKKISSSESLDYQLTLKKVKHKIVSPIQKNKKIPINKTPKKPLLVIIIDDVAFKRQVNEIKAIPFKITPSFFPPTTRHPNTPKYAKEFPVYMVHVPMEALHFSKPEPKTLNVGDDYIKIKKTIEEIKTFFPTVKFINNHTGSKFTADTNSMKILFKVLKEENLGFVDSKTTPISKAYIAEKYYKVPLFSRNVFLDNVQDINYIKNQLKKAVNIAKKRGYAIAIGHPHKATIEALKSSKEILKNVKVVYIDELAKYTN